MPVHRQSDDVFILKTCVLCLRNKMNKLVNGFRCNSGLRIHWVRFLTKNCCLNNEFNVKTIDIRSSLQKTTKFESFVFRSFFGELDADYLSFPKLVENDEESRILNQQYQFVQENFMHLCSDPNRLKQCGFFELSTLTETEKVRLFEAMGSSLEFKKRQPNESTGELIKLDQLSVTDSFLTSYKEKKQFLKTIIPLLIRNSIILNTIQNSNNDSLREQIMSDFKNIRIALAFDEPNDTFMSPPYPFWQSTAHFDSQTNSWLLNGKKSRIPNDGGDYDYYLLFCRIKQSNDCGIGSFLIPTEQLSIEPDGTDNYGTRFESITFKNLNVTKDDSEVLIDNRATMLLNMKASGHLSISAILLGIMKQVLNNVIDISNQQTSTLFTNHVTRLSEMIYSLESVLYLTSSHYDTFELNQIDLYLQAMVVKILAAEYCEQMVRWIRLYYQPRQLSRIVSQDMNDVINVVSSVLDTPTSLRMLLASYGLRSVGQWRYDLLVKLRLNRIYPINYWKYQFERYRRRFHLRYPQAYDGFNALQTLHPLLKDSAHRLKQVLEIENNMADNILRIYGKECVKNQIDMNRFSSIAMNAFQMVSVISRTNDSLGRQSPLASQELKLCENICRKAHQEVIELEKLIEGIEEISEERRTKIVHQSNMRFDGYFARPTFDRVV